MQVAANASLVPILGMPVYVPDIFGWTQVASTTFPLASPPTDVALVVLGRVVAISAVASAAVMELSAKSVSPALTLSAAAEPTTWPEAARSVAVAVDLTMWQAAF